MRKLTLMTVIALMAMTATAQDVAKGDPCCPTACKVVCLKRNGKMSLEQTGNVAEKQDKINFKVEKKEETRTGISKREPMIVPLSCNMKKSCIPTKCD